MAATDYTITFKDSTTEVGYITFKFVDGGVVYLVNMEVKEGYKGQGIGAKLLIMMCGYLMREKKNPTKIFLEDCSDLTTTPNSIYAVFGFQTPDPNFAPEEMEINFGNVSKADYEDIKKYFVEFITQQGRTNKYLDFRDFNYTIEVSKASVKEGKIEELKKTRL